MARKILIVEDDAETRNYLTKALGEAGFVVETAANGKDGLFLAIRNEYDLILLDRMLPELDGLAVLKSLRAAGNSTPTLMLTAMSAVEERVRGLREGADDYLVKPFSFDELSARIEALLRRPKDQAEEHTLSCRDLEMNLVAHKVERAGVTIELKPREFQLLEYLLRRKNRVVTRTMLLEGLWDYHFDPQTNVIDVHMGKLRRKIDGPDQVPLLKTVRGAGYMLSDEG
ncbi:response regulator transcription factor [Falsihalocynthiibacter sp. SS001]|uniref:response regulator transcription factor n=1 Tax=Falsihalocynthiibacter sp. SS001 TaxID=3349698 RepID=UPI0036D398D3